MCVYMSVFCTVVLDALKEASRFSVIMETFSKTLLLFWGGGVVVFCFVFKIL